MGNFQSAFTTIASKRDLFLRAAAGQETSFYVYDQEELDASIDRFTQAFGRHIPRFQAYYAVKLNHHPFIIRRVLERGLGLDVASQREISIALQAAASKIAYFSPGKSDADLVYAINHADIVRISIDSFGELHRLGVLTNLAKKSVNASIRFHLPSYGSWSKYGIPLAALQDFFREARHYPFIQLDGVHFHQSRNRTVDFYKETIHALGDYIREHLTSEDRQSIKYIDLGGGFEPDQAEGVIKTDDPHHQYKMTSVPTIEEYAVTIGAAIREHLEPIMQATYLSEPGRYICNSAMHIVLRVVDVKDKRNIILNGGVNMVGWQRFEHEYFPVFNVSSLSDQEIECYLWGNLCTTWDIWGYRCYAKDISEGDIIVVPNQGALTYSLAQNFIHAIPPVVPLR